MTRKPVKLGNEKPKPLLAAEFCLQEQLDLASPIAGIDEVGRGPLVGAVLAAAVILPENHGISELADSKKLTEKKRDELDVLIRQKALAFALGRAEAEEIDKINILQASLLAMKRAFESLQIEAAGALVDGNKLPDIHCPTYSVVKGDSRVQEIAAASIIAKVARDSEMQVLDAAHPEYGFAKHKGYPTAQHLEQLKRYGPLPEHRKSFGPVRKLLEN